MSERAARTREYMKKWRALNREHRNRYKIEYAKRPEQKAHKRAYDRRRYQENGEKIRADVIAYNKRNPAKKRAWRLLREWRLKNASGSASDAQVFARLEFYGWRCAYCPGKFEHLDHVIPVSLGGTNWPANLRPACAKCNLTKSNKRLSEWRSQ
jgi:5-methylcytosine-specific restriction endonuclease McrA